jgi:hypothetical protein
MNNDQDFFKMENYEEVSNHLENIYFSPTLMKVLVDFERVLDEGELFAYENWILGELVDGPNISRYDVKCVFLYPEKIVPSSKATKRLVKLGCTFKSRKTKIKVRLELLDPTDYTLEDVPEKRVEKTVYLIEITVPKELMNDIRQSYNEMANEMIDTKSIDEEYEMDLQEDSEDSEQAPEEQMAQDPMMDMGMGPDMGGGLPPPPMPGGPGMGGF